MTRAEALAEARRRWGSSAGTRDTGLPRDDARRVGFGRRGAHWQQCGAGATWEAAFADADRHGEANARILAEHKLTRGRFCRCSVCREGGAS